MLTCREITGLATEYAEGALDTASSRAFEGHLAGCDACRRWVEQLQTSARALGMLPDPEMPAALERELLQRFAGWSEGRAAAAGAALGRRALAAVPVLLAAMGGLVAAASKPSLLAADWIVGVGLAAIALALAAAMRRLTGTFALALASAALAAALVRGGPGPLEAIGGIECLLVESAMAACAMGVVWFLVRRGPAELVRSSVGAWAVAGAMAGDAALQVTCAQHASLLHLAVFHAGGVAATAAAAWLLVRPAPRAPRAA